MSHLLSTPHPSPGKQPNEVHGRGSSYALWLLCAVALWLAMSTSALAQTPPNPNPNPGPGPGPGQQGSSTAFQLQQFRPSLDPNGLIQSHGADTLGQWAFQIGAAFNYSWSPLFLIAEGSNQQVDVINHQIGMDLALGIGILPFLDITVVLPMTLYQIGQLPQLDILGAASGRSLTGFSISDLKVRAKLQTLNQRIHGVSLGFQVGLGIPTGNDETFNGEDTISFQIAALLSGAYGRVDFSINFGYRYLPETNFLGLVIGHELFYNAGLAVAIVPKRFDVIADLTGIIGLSGSDRINSPMGVLLGGRVWPTGSRLMSIQLGVGIGILKGYGSPGFRVFAGVVFYPAVGRRTRDAVSDRDKDGVLDHVDRCPGRPGPSSNNGCPPTDTDRDGTPDKLDRCPRQYGPKSSQGCPPSGRTPPQNPNADTDGDGVPNRLDRCPNAKGPASNQGCPKDDRDGDGTPDKLDRCPGVAGPASNKGCPMPDSDGDGLADNIDRCPKRAGPASNKGCPLGVVLPRRGTPPGPNLTNRDRDKDGIPDAKDRCPGLPGKRSRRGCPRRRLIKMSVRKRRIYLRKRLKFRGRRLKRTTKRVMRQVARLMKSFPTMKIRITATTYSRSRRRWVKRRSWRHARALRNYLRKLGVSRKRISIRGKRRYRRRRSTRTYYRIDIRRF